MSKGLLSSIEDTLWTLCTSRSYYTYHISAAAGRVPPITLTTYQFSRVCFVRMNSDWGYRTDEDWKIRTRILRAFSNFFGVTPKRGDLCYNFLRKRIFANTGPTPFSFTMSRSDTRPNSEKHFWTLDADTPHYHPDNAAVSPFSRQVGISWFWH